MTTTNQKFAEQKRNVLQSTQLCGFKMLSILTVHFGITGGYLRTVNTDISSLFR